MKNIALHIKEFFKLLNKFKLETISSAALAITTSLSHYLFSTRSKILSIQAGPAPNTSKAIILKELEAHRPYIIKTAIMQSIIIAAVFFFIYVLIRFRLHKKINVIRYVRDQVEKAS